MKLLAPHFATSASTTCAKSLSKSHRFIQKMTKAVPSSAEATPAKPVVYEGLVVPDHVQPLVTPLQLGRFELQHRLVLAPLTRCRATGTIPQPAAAEYYAQRTTPGGLLLTEATCICPEGHGHPDVPGIYTREQIEAWKPIVKAVHDKGGIFFLQLWHVGRASHSDYQPDGLPPKAPSPIRISDKWSVATPSGEKKYETPRELTVPEIKEIIQTYATAAKNAIEAGFDGVEVHGANGYLIDEFLKDGINKRTDDYGGSIENRARFALEVVDAVCAAVGSDRVGIRISPFTTFLDAVDSHPYATHGYLLEELNSRNLAYAHLVESRSMFSDATPDSLEPFRKIYRGTFLAAGGFVRETTIKALQNGHADAIVMGRWYISNPDLLKRWILDAPLNKYDRSTFFVNEQVKGYTDYPFLEDTNGGTKPAAVVLSGTKSISNGKSEH